VGESLARVITLISDIRARVVPKVTQVNVNKRVSWFREHSPTRTERRTAGRRLQESIESLQESIDTELRVSAYAFREAS
jgi:hypothetical protein